MSLPYPNAAADKLIEQHAPVERIRPLFGTRRAFAAYFGAVASKLNDVSNASGPCLICNDQAVSAVAEYRWQARFFRGIGFGWLEFLLLAVGHLGVKAKYDLVEFRTYHPLCKSCKRRLGMRRLAANGLNFAGLSLLIVAGGAAALGWSGIVYFHDTHHRDEQAFFLQLALVATCLTLVGAICMVPIKKLRVPAALRYFATRPFRLLAVKHFSFQQSANGESITGQP